jgi:hypothetical protein
MNSENHTKIILGRFRPVSWKSFSQYAKSLARLTGDSLCSSQNTLAHIYRYSSLAELRCTLENDGEPGPFDDDIPSDAYDSREVQDAITVRVTRALSIIEEVNIKRYKKEIPCPSPEDFHRLQLFSRMSTHKQGLSEMAMPKTNAAERRQLRETYLPNARTGDSRWKS